MGRIGTFDPQVVIIPWWVPYWAPAWTFLGWQIKRLPNRPKLIFICHNVLPHEQNVLDMAAIRVTLARGDGFIVHAHSDAEELLTQIPGANVQVTPIPTFAPVVSKEIDLPVKVPDVRPLLVFCGFVRPYKGLDILLEAMPLVLAKRPVHLLVAGEFWQGQEGYDQQIERLRLGDSVSIIDQYLPNEMLATCITRADVMVLPYRSATQSAIIQLAFGLDTPVITTDVGGLAEVVEDGRTGLIIPPENPEALAAAIDTFFSEEMGPQFQKNIEEQRDRFSWKHLVTNIQRLVGEAIKESS